MTATKGRSGAPTSDGGRAKRRPAPSTTVVCALFVVLSVGAGIGFYGLSAFAKDLIERSGFSLSTTAVASTAFLLTSGIGGLFVARGVSLIGVRGVLSTGTAVLAGFLAALGYVSGDALLWIIYAVGGLGFSAMSLVPASGVIVAWFGQRSARPLALAVTGISVGGVVVAPGLALWVQNSGLRTAGPIIAGLMCALLVPVIYLVKSPPPQVAVTATAVDGAPVLPTIPGTKAVIIGTDEPASDQPTRGRVSFALITIGFSLMLLSQVAVITSMLTLMQDKGFEQGSIALTTVALAAAIGRLAGIPALSKFGLRRLSYGIAALQAISMWLIAAAGTLPLMLLGVVLLGITVGNVIVLIPLWILGSFGSQRYSRQYSRSNLGSTLGTAASPLVLAGLHSLFGNFAVPLLILGVGSALGCLFLVLVPKFAQPVN